MLSSFHGSGDEEDNGDDDEITIRFPREMDIELEMVDSPIGHDASAGTGGYSYQSINTRTSTGSNSDDTADITMVNSSSTTPALKRTLSYFDGLGIVVGIIIGSGIFSAPGVALNRMGSPGGSLLIWLTGGLLVSITSQCYFELGAMFPSAGGDFEYLKHAYGDRAAFSFAWFNFFVSKPGSQAIIATIFGRYISNIVTSLNPAANLGSYGDETAISKVAATGIIVVITAINCAGLRESSTLQNILTASKLLLVLVVFTTAVVYCSTVSDAVLSANLSVANSFTGNKDFLHFGSALVACLWSFDGWCDLSFMQEELINPIRDLPRIVLSGIAIVTVAFLLANIAYLSLLNKNEVIESTAIAVDFGRVLDDAWHSGKSFSLLFASGVVMSTAGSLNGSIMTGGRAFYAVARDGKAPSALSKLNGAGAPWVALFAQGIWGIVLLLLPGSSFSSLLDYFGPMSWFFYALTSSTIIALRWQNPGLSRPYKVLLYPVPPLIVIFMALVIISSALMDEPLYCSLAIFFVSASIPFHFFVFEDTRALKYYFNNLRGRLVHWTGNDRTSLFSPSQHAPLHMVPSEED